MPEYLTLQEVADLLRISERTAYTRCREGQLPGAAKVAGKWRVERAALEEWLREGGEAPRQAPQKPGEAV